MTSAIEESKVPDPKPEGASGCPCEWRWLRFRREVEPVSPGEGSRR